MIVALDVTYTPDRSLVAAVGTRSPEEAPTVERTLVIEGPPADYEPGAFWRRELPPLLALLEAHGFAFDAHQAGCVLVVDGHAWLRPGQPGLGARLFEALGGRLPVVGVAKTAFDGSPHAARVLRGTSLSPLFVTAAGLDQALAADLVRRLHGLHRMPTLLGRADRLSRGGS